MIKDIIKVQNSELDIPVNLNRTKDTFSSWYTKLSPHTKRNYINDLSIFAEFLIENGKINGSLNSKTRRIARKTRDVSDEEDKEADICRFNAMLILCYSNRIDLENIITNFIAYLEDKKDNDGERWFTDNTVTRIISCLRSLYKYIVKSHLVLDNKLKKNDRVKSIDKKNAQQKVMKMIQIARKQKDIVALRNEALIWILFTSGLRRSEVASMTIGETNLQDGTSLVIRKGSRGTRQKIELGKSACNALKKYFDARDKFEDNDSVFINVDHKAIGGNLTSDGIFKIIVDLSTKAGFGDSITPHILRHFGAYTLAKMGLDANTIRKWGGWTNLITPTKYISEAQEDCRKAVDTLDDITVNEFSIQNSEVVT